MDAKIEGYITELREQNSILSDRAAQLAAALVEERRAHTVTKDKVRILENGSA